MTQTMGPTLSGNGAEHTHYIHRVTDKAGYSICTINFVITAVWCCSFQLSYPVVFF